MWTDLVKQRRFYARRNKKDFWWKKMVFEMVDDFSLLIYKFESFSLFKILIQKVNRDISSFLIKGNLPMTDAEEVHEAKVAKSSAERSKIKEGRQDPLSAIAPTAQPEITAPIHVEKKVGRNDPCPCGSGKKFKNCHGREE